MAGQVGANFAQLGGTTEHLVASVTRMNTALADLKSYLAPMVSTWEGDASVQYQALQQKWDTSAAELNATLQRIGAALGDTNDQFQATERANAARF